MNEAPNTPFAGDADGGTNLAMGAGSMGLASLNKAASAGDFASTYAWVVRRLWLTPLYVLTLAALLFAAKYPLSRIAVVVVLYLFSFSGQWWAVRAGRAGFEKRFSFSQGLVATVMVLSIATTGGLVSPLLVSLMSLAVGMMTHYGRRRTSLLFGSVVALAVLAMGVAPPSLTGPPVVYPWNVVMTALAFVYSLFMAGSAIVLILDASRQSAANVDRLRHQLVLDATSRTRSLESITSKVAHELKNPLAAIKGLAQLLSRGEAEEKKKQRLAVIIEEIARMEIILRDYLSFARPLEDLRTEPVDLGAIADDVAAVMEARAEQAGVALTRSGESATITGDARRLKEALLNLVANAIEATPAGGSVAVSIGRDETGDVRGARIVVKDTGKGLSPEAAARIGTPFYSTRDGGTGLGVVVARAAVAQHGGDVAYDGAPGRGTTVTITLPAHPPRAEAMARVTPPDGATSRSSASSSGPAATSTDHASTAASSGPSTPRSDAHGPSAAR
jgi:signal transduction histidine kinase